MTNLVFLPRIPITLIFTLAFLVIGITYYTYSRIKEGIPGFLFLLRLGAIVIIVFILLQPSFSIMKEKKERNNIIILIDNSPSMKIEDEGHKSRLDRLKGFIRNRKDFFDMLGKNNNLRFYSFSGRLNEISFEEIDNLKTGGSETNYADVIEDIKKRFEPKSINCIFLLSDGIDNKKENTRGLLRDFYCPIYTISPGDERIIKDISVYLQNYQETAYIDKNVKIFFSIKYSGQGKKNVTVILKENKVEIEREKFLINQGENNLSLDFIPRKTGLHHYSLNVPVEKGEAVAENNEDEFYMDVRKDKVYILFLTGAPSLEYKFLHRYLLSDPNIKTTFLVAKNDESMNRAVHTGGFFQLKENEEKNTFPNKKEELFEYDLIIFKDFDLNKIPSGSRLWFEEFVTERGGGLLLLGGKKFFKKGNSDEQFLDDISPVVFQSKEPFWDESRFIPELTRGGKFHPVTQLHTDSKRNIEIWSQLPLLEGYNVITEAKPGAQVLAVYPGDKNKIIMAVQNNGRGKSMAIMLNDLWRWNFLMAGIGKKPEYYENFIGRSISWLTSSKMGNIINLETDKISYSFKDKINLMASVYDRDFSSKSFEINGRIEKSDKAGAGRLKEENEIIRFSPLNENMNLFRAEYSPAFTGELEITVEAKSEKGIIGTARNKIFVKKNLSEWKEINLDETFLKEIAQISRGRFFSLSEKSFLKNISEFDANLKSRTNKIKIFYQINLWDNIAVFCLFIAFLSLEWYFRKKKGLI